MYVVVCKLTEGCEFNSKGDFYCNKNAEVYWLPKAGGKKNPAARQLVLFTFTYGDTRKTKPLEDDNVAHYSWKPSASKVETMGFSP